MKTILTILLSIGLASLGCAAPPPWTAPPQPPPTPGPTMYLTPPADTNNISPYWYCYFTNNILVGVTSQNVTNLQLATMPVGTVEYAAACSNAAGRSACAVVTNNFFQPVSLPGQPGATVK
jgi:quinol-cytochrome oxidoreductase complex cytochrome b subunit